MNTVIITGGNGFIGTILTNQLLTQNFKVIVIDLVPSESRKINCNPNYSFIQTDLAEIESGYLLNRVNSELKGTNPLSIVHMAAWKDLSAAVDIPLTYYDNNLKCTLNALALAKALHVETFLYSSSAAVYSEDLTGELTESSRLAFHNAYGKSKWIGEEIVTDVCRRYEITYFNLRYQNPMGGVMGMPFDREDSMFGNIIKHLHDGKFTIHGDDYDTPDGTCIRDYVDVRDVVDAHLHFIGDGMDRWSLNGDTINIGTGHPYSCKDCCELVKELVPEFTWSIGPRRQGDSIGSWANVEKLRKWEFECKYSLKDSIKNLIEVAESTSKSK